MKKIFNIRDYESYFDGDDCTGAVIAALDEADKNGGGTVLFPKGLYHFYEKHCKHVQVKPYGNGDGLKKVPFPLVEKHGIVIEGSGSDFVFHGIMTPFVVDNSTEISLQNFKISFERAFHTEAKVIARDEKNCTFDCVINQNSFPTETENGKLEAYGDNMRLTIPRFLITEYNLERKEPAYNHKYYVLNFGKPGEEDNAEEFFWTENLDGGTIRVYMPGKVQPYVGSVMAFLNDGRIACSILIDSCSNVTLKEIDIFDAGAMAVVGQLSKNLSISGLRVRLRNEGEYGYDANRIISIAADATHFCNCMGSLTMQDCIFDSMLDDGTNIHGIFARVDKHIDKNSIFSFDHDNMCKFFRVGDEVSIMKLSDYIEVMRAKIIEVIPCSQERGYIYKFDREIPDFIDKRYVMDNMSTVLEKVQISRVKTGRNRPRGFLIASKGKIVVEDCEFRNSSSGIYMQPFGESCLESQAAEDVTIRNCRFINCGYADNCAAVLIQPFVTEGMAPVHEHITICNNVFETFGPACIEANNVKKIEIYDNKYILTNEYPEIEFSQKIILKDCNL